MFYLINSENLIIEKKKVTLKFYKSYSIQIFVAKR